MKILITGAGMYVTGRNKTGVGTVLASLAETSRYLPIEEVTVVALSPSNQQVVEEAAARINGMLGTSLNITYKNLSGDTAKDMDALCSKGQYDCAIISVPDHLHHEYAAALLRHNVHCLVVKPLTPTLAEAQDLVKIQQQGKAYAAVEFHKRWDETNLYIKRALAEQRLGKIAFFTVDYSQRIGIPRDTFQQWANKTNIFQYLGVHYVDLIYFLTRFRPVRLSAVGTNGTLRASGINTWDSVHTTIIWQNPADATDEFVSVLNISWIDPNITSALSDQKYKVIGAKGRIECDQKDRGLELVHGELGILHPNPYFSDYLPDADGKLQFGGYGHKSIDQFIKDVAALRNGSATVEQLEQSRPTFIESLVSTAIVDAVNKSLNHQFNWTEIENVLR